MPLSPPFFGKGSIKGQVASERPGLADCGEGQLAPAYPDTNFSCPLYIFLALFLPRFFKIISFESKHKYIPLAYHSNKFQKIMEVEARQRSNAAKLRCATENELEDFRKQVGMFLFFLLLSFFFSFFFFLFPLLLFFSFYLTFLPDASRAGRLTHHWFG